MMIPPPPKVSKKSAWDHHVREVYTSSDKQDWRTPPWLFKYLDDEFHFTLDAAADQDNHLCPRWFGPGGHRLNALAADTPWTLRPTKDSRVFCNPPYGREIKLWYNKVIAEMEKPYMESIVFLVNANTETDYWRRCVWEHAAEIRFILGRVQFVDPDPPPDKRKDAQTKGSAIVVWRRRRITNFPVVTKVSVETMKEAA